MTIKLDKTVRVRIRGLLNMLYTPVELASELRCEPALIEMIARTEGLQMESENGQVFINGALFSRLYEKRIGRTGGALINRENMQDVQAFLTYQKEVQLNSAKSLRCRQTQLRRLLEWAGSTLFPKIQDLRPTFPVFLLSYRADGSDTPITAETARRTCDLAQEFFSWCKRKYPKRYKSLPDLWIETLKPTRRNGLNSVLKSHEFYSLEEVQRLIQVPGNTPSLMRDRAAAAFLFLSGMRVDAFVSLPIECVDLQKMAVSQLPSKGVRTKNAKAAITYLLNIQDLLDVVKEWDSFIRSQLPKTALWYSILEGKGQQFSSRGDSNVSRAGNFRRDLKRLCKVAGVIYKSPHKFRHGHAVYAIGKAKNLEDLKATSQNLMHSSITITDGTYGNLNGETTRQVITHLGTAQPPAVDFSPLLQAMIKLQNSPELLQKILATP